MIPFIWAQLRGRAARSVALLVGVLTATTGFTVLTGATATARLEVTGEVDRNARTTYEILVRPHGTRTGPEDERAMVQPNALSGIYGGLTPGDLAKVRAVPGIDVAAPIAMAGWANAPMAVDVDVTGLVDRSLDRQVLRLDRTFLADRGLSSATGRPLYVYVTKHAVSWPIGGFGPGEVPFTGGERRLGRDLCGGEETVLEDGQPVCAWITGAVMSDLLTDRQYTDLQIVRLAPDGSFETADPVTGGVRTDRVVVRLAWHVPLLVAAVDPEAEQRLVGLGGALTAGRYLGPAEHYTEDRFTGRLPVIAADRAYPDNAARVAISRVPVAAAPPGSSVQDALAALDGLKQPLVETRAFAAEEVYRDMLALQLRLGGGPSLEQFMQVGGVRYRSGADGSLSPETTEADPGAWRTEVRGLAVPWQIDDTAFREIRQVGWLDSPGRLHSTTVVGTFDPARLETYQAPEAGGADPATRSLLGGRPLRPGGNPAAYLASPPALLTTLPALTELLAHTTAPNRDAPISAIRVRVAGVERFTATSRERVRVVAERIAATTGLDVDITYGSSAAPQGVDLAAGRYGRPALRLGELWTRKGVAAAIVSAVDRKSALLFGLVLIVCALFLGNAVAAAVRDRRAELATLSALGWPARRIFGAVLGEVTLIGLVAGAGTLLLAAPLGALLDVRVSWGRSLLAVPVAVALAALAGAGPAAGAARSRFPAAWLRFRAARARFATRASGPVTLGLANLVRVPGRTLLGAGALAVGLGAATLLGAVTFAFHGAIVGTLLGDAVSLQVRTVDTIAVASTVLLGAVAVADVLYLNIRDRAAELATLRATGWTAGALGRLVAAEGFGIGVLGGLLGAGLGLGGAAWLVGAVTTGLLLTAAGAVAAGALLATAAALVPALLLPTARALSEE
ncbi:FtsX-like permease family protein [Dactylosporangium sucinum]|uniref:FtsX-like permease family protein n=1 Tax=Dactylosporangium sucinum TaxID=1424081 RepID=UPI00167E4A60|nr:FtsX-like permease family protein [Dactylosporangium sucinum]